MQKQIQAGLPRGRIWSHIKIKIPTVTDYHPTIAGL